MIKRITLVSIAIILIGLLIYGCSYSPVDIENYEYKPSQKTKILSSDEEVIQEMYDQNSTYVKLVDMPENLINGIIAVEDARFYKHKGYDPIGILRAVFTNIKEGKISEGASTITQQLARNLFKEITTEKTLLRKINEALTARQLEKKYTKSQILEMYLNEIYLGSGNYGVGEASQEYFGKDVSELSLGQCAMLAGLPQAPSAYAPDEHFELAKKRQEIVLDRMVTGEYITEDEAAKAKKEEINIVKEETEESGNSKDSYSAYIRQIQNEYLKYLKQKFPKEEITKEFAIESLQNDGLKIYTTINSKMQNMAFTSLNQAMRNHGLQDNATGSFVTIDASTGAVLAYYGGNTEIDMANNPRQPGSTIKPFVYVKAFEEGIISPNTILLDEKTTFNYGGKEYSPDNAGGIYRGYITAREAIVNSSNIPAVKVMEQIGVENSVDFFKEFGITTVSPNDGLATILGGMTKGVSPLEMAKAYAVFANDGIANDRYFIEKITDSNDNVIYEHNVEKEDQNQVITLESANEIKDVLYDVVSRGTATDARSSYKTGGKTGTTNDAKDLWFVGFTGKITTSIWIGNLENKSISGKSSYCAQIYGDYLTKLVDDHVIPSDQLQKVIAHDDTKSISILTPPAQSNVDPNNITSDQVVDIIIPTDQETFFNDVRVTTVQIDKESGKVFVQDKCPQENKEDRYYLWGQEPTELCDNLHFLHKIEDFFNGDGNGNLRKDDKTKKNQTDNESLQP